jgi:hypothetical protein
MLLVARGHPVGQKRHVDVSLSNEECLHDFNHWHYGQYFIHRIIVWDNGLRECVA